MKEKNLNFDEVIDRHHTDCLKYDFAVERGKPEDVLPLWVADMDFRTSSCVQEAIAKRCKHGVFGYSEAGDEYYEAIADWMKQRHNFPVRREWMVKTPGVVFALAMAVKAYTNVGDSVLIQPPVYYPFSEVVDSNDRVIVCNQLVRGEDGRYYIDYEDFEKQIIQNHVKLFLLCNPHNPVGRVWEKEELKKLGEICFRHGVVVVSDEIHHDFVFQGHEHTVFATLGEEFQNHCVVCTSPSKLFNIAGLQASNIFIPNEKLRELFVKQVDAAGYSQINTFAIVACEAAYRNGGTWRDAVVSYIEDNMHFAKQYIEAYLSPVKLVPSDGTYLLWLDFRALNLTEEQREEMIVEEAGLWLDSGAIFGKAGEGFERVNIACPRSVLKNALDKLRLAVEKHRN